MELLGVSFSRFFFQERTVQNLPYSILVILKWNRMSNGTECPTISLLLFNYVFHTIVVSHCYLIPFILL